MERSALSDYLSRERILFIRGADRHAAIAELVACLCRDLPPADTDCREIERRVFEREAAMSSWIAPGVAVPHAIIDQLPETRVALGLAPQGIDWDLPGGTGEQVANPERRVRVIALVVGSRAGHLDALSAVAGHLREPTLFEALLETRTPAEAFAAIAGPAAAGAPGRRGERLIFNEVDVSDLTVEHAHAMAKRLEHARVVIHADAINDPDYLAEVARQVEGILVTSRPDEFDGRRFGDIDIVDLPIRATRRSTNVKFALLVLISRGLLSSRDLVVNVFGVPGAGFFDSVRLTQVEQEFEVPIAVQDGMIRGGIVPHVLTRVLQVASTLAAEGREGEAVGTMFVLGDHENVRRHAQQLIINPFRGHPEDQRNVLDPNLEETLKEYARIDGAFVIRGDGTVLSAGTFVRGDDRPLGHESGLGARHAAALGLSAATRAFVIAISESTRQVSLFYQGQRLVVF